MGLNAFAALALIGSTVSVATFLPEIRPDPWTGQQQFELLAAGVLISSNASASTSSHQGLGEIKRLIGVSWRYRSAWRIVARALGCE